MRNTWTPADVAIAAARFNEYLVQFLLAKGIMTTPELQNMVDQLIQNAEREGEGAIGVFEYTKAFARVLPGITAP